MVDPDWFATKRLTNGEKSFATATKIVSVPIPNTANYGEVIVRVTHAGVQASDVIQMAGGYGVLSNELPSKEPNGMVQPGDLGCEGVGIILKLGEGVNKKVWNVGQSVCFGGFGVSFREITMVPATSLIKVPNATPEWTAFPVSAMTATGGLEVVGKIRNHPKEQPSVLVTGAAGGTGHMAVQFAKHVYGAKVAGTCGSASKEDMLASIGCDVIVNYRKSSSVEDELRAAFPNGFDIVYDGVGGSIGNVGRKLLAPNGVFVGIGSVSEDYSGTEGPKEGNQMTTKSKLQKGQTETFFFTPAGPTIIGQEAWADLVDRTKNSIASGKVNVWLDEESSSFVGMEGVYQAQERMRTGLNVGKIYTSFPPSSGP